MLFRSADDHARVLGHTARRQRPERGALFSEPRFMALMKRVIDDAPDKCHVGFDARKVTAPPHEERLQERALEQVVRLLGDTILVGLTGSDARRLKAVVLHDLGEPPRQRPPVFASSCVAADRLSCLTRSGTPPSAHSAP